MHHLPALIQDLTLILVAAGLVTVLFKKIRQPVVLGYILVGFLVGRHSSFLPNVADEASIQVWAEIGIIFLLFALGLEFSFKKLARVGGSASITAFVEVVSMLGIGFITGRLMGWSNMDSLFLGGILAISSTTIIIRAFEEVGVKGRGFVSIVFGVLIVEDLFAILLMVLLSTVAVSQQFEGLQLVTSFGKLVFFLTLWFLSGIFLLPTLLKRMKEMLSGETLLLLSLALCFLMVHLATQVGFSAALGAFIMGSILAETTEGKRIEHLVQPVKDLFAAIFFVSVGMLIDPELLWEHAGPVLLLTAVTIFGKLASTALGAVLSGQSVRHSVQSGMSLAQIGEFSFIIAALGQSLKVTSPFLYPIAVGVSAITTFSTPYLIRFADPVADWVERTLPASWKDALERYRLQTRTASHSSAWGTLVKSYLLRIVVNGVLISGIFLLVARILPRIAIPALESARWGSLLSLGVALVLSAPFWWALCLGRPKSEVVASFWANRRTRTPIVILELIRFVSAVALFAFLSQEFVSLKISFGIAFVLIAMLIFGFSRRLDETYRWIESRFIRNLSEKEREEAEKRPALAPWDAHIAQFSVQPEAPVVGKTLQELGIRERYGVTLALIERGQKRITAPTRNDRIYPFDRVSVIGTDEQIEKFRPQLESADGQGQELTAPSHYSLQSVSVPANSPFVSKTIRDSGLRERSNGLIVGIEREGKRILNPDSTLTIQPSDVLWVVADEKEIRGLKESGALA